MNSEKLNSPSQVAAALGSGTAAIIVFAIMPILVGAMADRFSLDDLRSGLVATAYFSTYAIVALTSPLWIRRWNWRVMSLLGFSLMVISLSIAMMASSYTTARIAVAASGMGAGFLFPISLTLVSDMENTEQVYGLKLAVEQLVPAGVLILLSTGLFLPGDYRTTVGAILAVVVVCLLVSYAMPSSGTATDGRGGRSQGSILTGILALAALSLSFAGFAGVWVFMERIGVEQGFDGEFINLWLAVGLLTSGVGPLLAAALGDRVGRALPLLLSTVAALTSMVLLAGELTPMAYALALTLFPLTYYFSISYIFSVVAAADTNGRIAGLMSFALAMGAAAGPAIFGAAKNADGPVLMLMAACMAVGALALVLIAKNQQRIVAID